MKFYLWPNLVRKNFRATVTSLLMFAVPAFAELGPNDHASNSSSIPTTADYPNNCFVENEIDDWEMDVERVSVSGCSKPIVKPPRTVTISSFYVDRSTYLCTKYREYVRTILPLRNALSDLNLATARAARNPLNRANVICVVNTILTWAQTDALANVRNMDGSEAITAWNLGAMAANFLKLPTVMNQAREMGHLDFILSYFKRRGDHLLADIQGTKPEMLGHNKNVWKGFALTALGLATKQESYFRKGKEIFDIAINEIAADSSNPDENGYLPLEITRGKKAHSYHIYTLQPMLGMINLSKATNCNFLDTFNEEDRLALLVQKLEHGRLDPSIFHRRTGQEQSSLTPIEGLFSLLGDDAQSGRILNRVTSYLVARNLKLDPKIISSSVPKPSSVPELGGDVSLFPAPLSIPRSSNFRQFCGKMIMSYSQSSYHWIKGSPILPQSPTLSSGQSAISCSISPNLPRGLDFNAKTCRISGVPTATSSQTTYRIRATGHDPKYETAETLIEIKIRPPVYYVPFSCSVNNNTAGCEKVARCNSSDVISSVKIGCNLESASLTDSQIEGLPSRTLAVIVPSDKVSDGKCEVSWKGFTISLQSSTSNLPIPMTNSLKAKCSERDGNGGDCMVQGVLTCSAQ